jgi:hypothetical protein
MNNVPGEKMKLVHSLSWPLVTALLLSLSALGATGVQSKLLDAPVATMATPQPDEPGNRDVPLCC